VTLVRRLSGDARRLLRGGIDILAEIGDVRRFENPRQLMAFLGLVPSGRSTADSVRRAGLTLAGNRRARRALVEGAWTYRCRARVSAKLQKRLEVIPKAVRDIAWKAQVRLCGRFRRLAAIGKKRPVIVAAIAREMAAFRWASAGTSLPLPDKASSQND
jgi:transposase